MRFIDRKVGLAIGAGVASLGLFGAVALAAFAPDAAPAAATLVPANAQDLAKDGKHADKLKDLLDGLVKKGVITQPQEDAILAALKDAAGDREHERAAKHVLEGLFAASAKYLGLTEKDLHAKLPGHSLGEIANTTAGHDRAGLIAALNTAANDAIAKALADKKITDDQAKKLRDSLATRIPEFVDRKWPTKPAVAPRAGSDARGFLGDITKAALDYLGLSKDQLEAAMRGGNSLAQIAVGQGKTRQGLYDAITSAAFKRVDDAQAAGKLTADQAKAAKDRIAIEVNTFIDRKPGATTNSVRTAIGNLPTVKRPTAGTP